MTGLIIVSLVSVCIVLLYVIARQRKILKELLMTLQGLQRGEKRKVFVKSNGIVSQIALEVNEILATQGKETRLRKKREQSSKELLTSLSHDVRTPLTSLLGYLDALETGFVRGEEKQHYIKIARKKAYDLKGFVDTLFDWFKIDSGEMQMTMKPMDVCELTKEIIIEWLPVFEENTINPVISIPDKESIVFIDQVAYRRAVANVIQNAVEHSGCHQLKIDIRSLVDRTHIIITDDGVGIPKDQIPHVFSRMYKIDRARSRPSSGLGLCIAKELCEKQGGSIEVKSTVNKYTTFTISLGHYTNHLAIGKVRNL